MVFQPTEMIFYGWTFATLMTFVRATSHVQLNNESYVTFLSENGKNNTKYFSWGLFDTTATVGMVFHYNISAVLPRGEDVKYVVSEVGSNNYKLPNWLQFDNVTGCLIGVPNASDGTKIFYLKVFLIDNHNSRFDVEDVFSIKVNEQTPFYAGSSARSLQSHETTSMIVKCLPGSTVTTTTVLIDADFKVLLPSDMVRMIQNLCKHIGLSLTATRLVSPATIHYLDNAVLVAGPGDVKVPLHTGAWFQWEVGCGNVYSYHMGILQKLEFTSQNGDLSLSIGFGIIGWYVTNVKTLHTNVYRLKRQAPMMLTTPTIIQTMGRPPAAKAVPTATVSESKSTDDPQTRVVLSQTSPVYSTIEATDLHNAYIKSSGRHHIRTRSKTAMPKLAKTSFYVTPSVTPVRKVIPTEFSYEANGKFVNTKSSFISDGDLEPSVIMPQATNTAPTAILETRMNIMTDYSSVRQRSKVVQPSHSVSTSRVPAKVFTGNSDFQTSRQWLDDTGPRVNAELGTLSSTVRKVFMYKIPDHLFSDSIDGNTNNLKLQFSMPDGYDTSIVPWVKFNEATHMLFGFPLNISNRQYFLLATNSRGKSSRVGFYINVRERSKDQRVHFEMSITLEADFEIFINNVSALVDIATKISSAFGDKQPSELLVTSINQGSVEYNWTNSSLSADPCQIDKILTLAKYFIMPNCSLNGHFLETLKPFIIKKAAIVPKLSCSFEAREAVIPLSTSSPSYRIVPQVETESAETDAIVNIIVPIVISVAVVILVIIIVCVLYRKWHKADRTGRKNVKKGTPVIFTAELEDKLIASNKPLIMDNERPPHPPNYQQASVIGNFPSTPHSKCYEPLISANQNCSIAGIPTQSSTIKSQQRCMGLQTSYRNPPPYDAP